MLYHFPPPHIPKDHLDSHICCHNGTYVAVWWRIDKSICGCVNDLPVRSYNQSDRVVAMFDLMVRDKLNTMYVLESL